MVGLWASWSYRLENVSYPVSNVNIVNRRQINFSDPKLLAFFNYSSVLPIGFGRCPMKTWRLDMFIEWEMDF